MTYLRTAALALALVVAGALTVGAPGSMVSHAYAQGATTGQDTGEPTSWSQKKYNEWSAKWMKEKEKYKDCRAKARADKLRGKKLWHFMYTCMTAK